MAEKDRYLSMSQIINKCFGQRGGQVVKERNEGCAAVVSGVIRRGFTGAAASQ